MSNTQTPPDFLVHDEADTVGVIVVETVNANHEINGWMMSNDDNLAMMAKSDIPLGHKIALNDIQAGDAIIKYGHDIGKAISPIAKGEHVHVHNVKTKRW